MKVGCCGESCDARVPSRCLPQHGQGDSRSCGGFGPRRKPPCRAGDARVDGAAAGGSCRRVSAGCLRWARLKPIRVCGGMRPGKAKQGHLVAVSSGVGASHPAVHVGRALPTEPGKGTPPKARSPPMRRAEPIGEGRLRWGRGPGCRRLQGPAGTSTTSPRQSRVLVERGLARGLSPVPSPCRHKSKRNPSYRS